MGFRFRRSVRLFPGIRLNLSGSGISTSIGVRGASVNIGTHGVRGTVGIPGSGLSYSDKLGWPDSPRPLTVGPSADQTMRLSGFGWGALIAVAALGVMLARCASVTGSSPLPLSSAVPPPHSAIPAERALTEYVNARTLNCRAAPSTGATVIAALPKGTIVLDHEVLSEWSRVSAERTQCWVDHPIPDDAAPREPKQWSVRRILIAWLGAVFAGMWVDVPAC